MDSGKDLGPQGCCGGYRDRMKTTKIAFVANVIGLGHIHWCDGCKGRLRTTRVLWWLQRLAKDQHGGFYVRWVRLRAQIF